jgi:hypothetical protein
MTSLKQLQESFQRGILAGDDTILSEVNDSTKERRDVLFGVYRNAYVARLAEIVAEDYEQTHAYLGDARFPKLVKDYIAAHPSDQQNARWFGRHLPAFIEGTEPFARHPELAELALLERRSTTPSTRPTPRRCPSSIWQPLRPMPGRGSYLSRARLQSGSSSKPMPPRFGLRCTTRPRLRSHAACPSRKRSSSGGRNLWRASGRSSPRKP